MFERVNDLPVRYAARFITGPRERVLIAPFVTLTPKSAAVAATINGRVIYFLYHLRTISARSRARGRAHRGFYRSYFIASITAVKHRADEKDAVARKMRKCILYQVRNFPTVFLPMAWTVLHYHFIRNLSKRTIKRTKTNKQIFFIMLFYF